MSKRAAVSLVIVALPASTFSTKTWRSFLAPPSSIVSSPDDCASPSIVSSPDDCESVEYLDDCISSDSIEPLLKDPPVFDDTVLSLLDSLRSERLLVKLDIFWAKKALIYLSLYKKNHPIH